MIYPEFPKEGSVIGICAPSAGVGGKAESFDLSLEVLRGCGYEIYETENVRSEDYPSSPAHVRGAEFNSLYEDDDIDMVFCASGGDYCMEMLPYIDKDLVCSRPKWFAGYSDPTAIEMFLTTVCDIATVYGVNAGSFDWRPLHEYQFNALSIIGGGLPLQHSYEYYSSQGFNEETGTYEMDAPVEWTLLRGSGSEDDPDLPFWREIWDNWCDVNGIKHKTDGEIKRWLKNPYSEAEEYKMWGNGVALPCVFFVMAGIAAWDEGKIPEEDEELPLLKWFEEEQ